MYAGGALAIFCSSMPQCEAALEVGFAAGLALASELGLLLAACIMKAKALLPAAGDLACTHSSFRDMLAAALEVVTA